MTLGDAKVGNEKNYHSKFQIRKRTGGRDYAFNDGEYW